MGFWLLGIPLLAFALWLKLRPYRNGTFSELWGAPSDQDYIEAGLPPRDPRSYDANRKTDRLFGPFPEEDDAEVAPRPARERSPRPEGGHNAP